MKWSELKRKLKKEGFEFLREAKGSHEVWHHPERPNSEMILTSHNSKEVGTGLANKLLKQAGLK
ncbi:MULTISPECIES: type II toxin-antitoxin system HicA family toxin [unclassified Pedobacter]|uniref:type II toxin-antitoxin system HicA family toxin n=1 Tax=Pedobacter sp. SG918 TaxID=2587136 RepID=UPI00141FE5C2|nr:putative RNA binding protein YcfA (HicA-like mRNA interferase family) [Pedobacter sp. SG908]NMN35755.1 putative RNA binding protein YcfA (HicA-like mRNA interferase family) [Pedobacter sp. SG918]